MWYVFPLNKFISSPGPNAHFYFIPKLNNGDVVSILTGEGKPTTEWMRFAKSRSTRSKLRAHFRAKQHDSVTKTGESMFFDYLKNHRDEIRGSSYLGYEFDVPLDNAELSRFLPGRSHYTDVDELLFAIGEFILDRCWCRWTCVFCGYRTPRRVAGPHVADGGVCLLAVSQCCFLIKTSH